MSDGKKRDRPVRVPLTQVVQLTFPSLGNFIEAYSANISEGGMFVQTKEFHPVGTVIQLHIQLKSVPEPLRLTGKVTWVRDGRNGELPGMGISFDDLDDRSRETIRSIVELNRNLLGNYTDWTKDPNRKPSKPAPDPPDVAMSNLDQPDESLIGGTIDFDQSPLADDMFEQSTGQKTKR